MDAETRRRFDRLLDRVVAELPGDLQSLLEEVPAVVDDWAPKEVAQDVGARPRDLCGLYTGVPLTERSVQHSGVLPEEIHLYRGAILRAAAGRRGDSAAKMDRRLRREIRITLLHEMGHHFGLSEEDLRKAGYE